MTVNKAILVGNLGRAPEVKTTAGGTSVCNLSVATSHRTKDRHGNWGEASEWHRVTCFGKTAENAGNYLKKGRQVYVEGRIQTRKWQDKEGRDRYTTEIVAFEVKFLGGKGDSAGGGQRRQQSHGGKREQRNTAPQSDAELTFADDSIPF